MTPSLSLLLTLIFFFSCNNQKPTSTSVLLIENDTTDTIKPSILTSFEATAYPEIFEAAFSNSTKVTHGNTTYSFEILEIGNIKVKSGKLIACDPIVMHEATPFTQTFPIGEFPVHLAIAKTHNDQRVAFSRVVFSKEAITKWEFGLLQGEKPIPLKDTSFYCYGVDAGTGIFIDSASNTIFSNKEHSEWEYVFVTKAEENGHKGYIHNFEGHNLATFSTGYGDGCYATYIGFDKQGNVCQLLTDFALVEWWKLETKK